ncbi:MULTISPECIES: Fe-S cluster assembly protein SufD [unclassified Microcoleus]|uniref:Fe-S cluster assembly protein SufD n=1 Tax=unclassified Microcoleus TaxID=2642155 RepID=UPI001D9AB345|nr:MULTISPECIES: Fe-S cluster assembly protein SufD [unclassified Microcoleus]MCC3440302.1 Fe-S cluster assembly protein SufD [Microcoleus sp. PH2017_03_ELD_O_A]MCC3468799.1 Fe-S cluster assembly protein SufD [Microcoleus sp. PH2017_06_SFM_O_A]MCC3503612.1 Fe-S cluster assembly protein SufD [Microcoleus sp. PH2017_19_SFW_U_A]MCC3521530.1 Fe-S cluster assembly protein SufD [Microcoleus sp. PH2017_20_SFW_D_A]MCC3552543.1 Fe-S cluster assembly protein SufD [Microcoleus sp. PH2017_35_SFW_U_B]
MINTQVATREMFLADLVNQCGKLEVANSESSAYGLQDLRDAATEYVLAASFPTVRDEEWRFTDLSPVLQVPFHVPQSNQSNVKLTDIIMPVKNRDDLPLRLVFVNGFYAPDLSTGNLPDFYVGNLSNVPEKYRSRITDVLSKHKQQTEVFTALNTAGLVDAAVVFVPANMSIDLPIHLLFLTAPGASGTMCQPHCLIIAEAGSNITVVEDYATIGNVPAFTNAVTDVVVGENATVNHVRLQREGLDVVHIGKSAIEQARNSRYTCHAISLGGKISRHNLEVFQRGEGTETTLNGLTVAFGEQLADTHSLIDFNHPHGTSRQLHKCIVGNKARAVFNGKVFVRKAAQLTDAGQLSRNLLLSPRARVDTKPQLEIVADNVKCSHGATVSQLEDDELFYLQSRGLDLERSRYLLIDAFAAEMLNQLPIVGVAKMLSTCMAIQE